MAHQLQGVDAEYVFFCAYLAKDDEKEAAEVNNTMLKNFLEAIAITGAEKKETSGSHYRLKAIWRSSWSIQKPNG